MSRLSSKTSKTRKATGSIRRKSTNETRLTSGQMHTHGQEPAANSNISSQQPIGSVRWMPTVNQDIVSSQSERPEGPCPTMSSQQPIGTVRWMTTIPNQAVNQGGLSCQTETTQSDARPEVSSQVLISTQQSCVNETISTNTLSQPHRPHGRPVASRYMGNSAKNGIAAKGKRHISSHDGNAQHHKEKIASNRRHEKKDCYWQGCPNCVSIT